MFLWKKKLWFLIILRFYISYIYPIDEHLCNLENYFLYYERFKHMKACVKNSNKIPKIFYVCIFIYSDSVKCLVFIFYKMANSSLPSPPSPSPLYPPSPLILSFYNRCIAITFFICYCKKNSIYFGLIV